MSDQAMPSAPDNWYDEGGGTIAVDASQATQDEAGHVLADQMGVGLEFDERRVATVWDCKECAYGQPCEDHPEILRDRQVAGWCAVCGPTCLRVV